MHRDRLADLNKWRTHPDRKPLILRGCRQVGKSWLVRKFAESFEGFLEINFEKDKSIRQYFTGDLNINVILEKLAIHTNTVIHPGNTLIFFDEIQECEDALKLLRYFKEEKPELHVIAAGSLLEFALENVGIPVGRIQFLHLYPLSFAEFLTVSEQSALRKYISKKENDPVLHNKLIDHLKTYMWLGGMPAVVNAWLTKTNHSYCQEIQDEIIEAYRIDFHKYAKQHEIPHVVSVFEAIPAFLGNKFIYAHVNSSIRSELIKNALQLLERAGIAIKCFHTSAQQQPLGSGRNNKKFKVFYFDIGLAQRLLGLDIKQWLLNPGPLSNQGAIAEQFVAQELLAYSSFKQHTSLYYWHREAKSSCAEVDFLLFKQGQLVPVEVKSSKKGSMKSMHLFLEEHNHAKQGLKISEGMFAQNGAIEEIPFYAIEDWLQN